MYNNLCDTIFINRTLLLQLAEYTATDHGYTHSSITVQCAASTPPACQLAVPSPACRRRFFFQVLAAFDAQQRRNFLCFATGSPQLPVGGPLPPTICARSSALPLLRPPPDPRHCGGVVRTLNDSGCSLHAGRASGADAEADHRAPRRDWRPEPSREHPRRVPSGERRPTPISQIPSLTFLKNSPLYTFHIL
jgi:hypothetical protein